MLKYLSSTATTLLALGFVAMMPSGVTALTTEGVKELAAKITVLIPAESEGPRGTVHLNGSGAIIAKTGRVYTVLTASHVLCKDYQNSCQNYFYELKVVTPDGRTHTLDENTIKKLPGVDLAVFQFTSDRDYFLATLGDYELADEQFVFASGWPDPKLLGKRELLVNIGKLLPKAMIPFLRIYPPSLGYETVYTSITYGGMSGGPVLDTNGRVIAVHGQNEGEPIAGVPVPIGFSVSIPIRTFLRSLSEVGLQGRLKLANDPPSAFTNQEFADEIYKSNLASRDRAPDANNTNPLDWLKYGNQMWRLGQFFRAYASYDKALELDANLYQAWYGKGLVLTYWRKRPEAIAAYDRALQLKPSAEVIRSLRERLQGLPGVPSPSTEESPPPTSTPAPDSPGPSLW